ncbi:glycosyltransferase [Photobacterium leiognathi]|uniref:glycosyltransferase n=1 Tax=Photobacterium leiognathi TaxID=553611 RepID=UPI0027373854|nr:glycosyltransferase [Photobacterium leiognathi]
MNDINTRINIPDNIKHRVFLLGPRDNLSGIYPAFDLYVSSSYSEGFPNVIGEAMLSGLKVAATDVGDSKLLIDKYGEVCQVDSKELASCIESCLKLNFDAQSISNYISDCYSISAISQMFEEIY